MIALERVRAGADRARTHILHTPLVEVEGALLKAECLQPTGSFKVRGFFAAATQAREHMAERFQRGLLTVSAGNAAQACAYVAHTLGVPCRVVMYESAPPPKIEGVKRWGATPVLLPREEVLKWLTEERWRNEPDLFIHPFADPEVIAGHGSLGLELLEDFPQLRRVVVPVGGGGLISGVASALKAMKPEIEVVGVQSDGYALWQRAFAEGGAVSVKAETIADGTTAPFDARMFELLKECVDRWLVVPEPRLKAAIPELASSAKLVAEGAGGLAYAALEQLPPGPPTVAVVSGGNIDPRLLSELLTARSDASPRVRV